jgi:hypothetical protein
LRDEHLAAVTDRADSRGAVHTETDVPLAAHGRFTRMDPHPDAKLRVLGPDMIRQRALARDRGGDRVLRPSVRDEERVALRVDLAGRRAP